MNSNTIKVLFIALFLSFVGGCDDDSGAKDKYSGDRQQCVDEINAYRATVDLPPYERWTEGERCADDEAEQDSISGVAHGAFGQCDEYAQNECPGWPSVEAVIDGCLQAMWDEGPGSWDEGHGHYINMTSESYTEVACGFFVTEDGSVWSVQNFR